MNRRSASVALGVTASLAGALTAVAVTQGPDYQGVCVDEQTNQRVGDDECSGSTTSGHYVGRTTGRAVRWYYLRSDARFPGLGQRASGGSFTVPHDSSVHVGGVKAGGGHVSRGGFGGFHFHGGS